MMQYPGLPFRRKEGAARLIAALICALLLLAPGSQSIGAEPAPQGCLNAPCAAKRTLYLPLVQKDSVPPETLFGIQTYGQLSAPGVGLDLANQASVAYLRTQMSWAIVEPQNVDPQFYRWGDYDKSLLAAAQQGVRPVVNLLDNPRWAATYSNGPIDPRYLEEFGKFLGAAVERYDGDGVDDAPGSPRVRYWEFYNEPDSGDPVRAEYYGQAYWGNYGKQYAEMLCVAHWYMKNADPDVQLVFGGVAHDWFQEDGGPFVRSFVEDALAAGAAKCFDVMNFHYYPVFAARWQPYGPGILGKAEYFRTLLAKYGAGDRPLMCTESGWHSDTDGSVPSSLQIQAEYTVKLFAEAKAARLVVNIWWTWMDLDSAYGSYGLLTRSGSPKPAYYAYQVAASKIGKSSFSRSMTAQELGNSNLEGYVFSSPTSMYILWSNDGGVRTVRLPGSKFRVVDIFGKLITSVTDAQDGVVDGRVTVSVGSAPVYVENAR